MYSIYLTLLQAKLDQEEEFYYDDELYQTSAHTTCDINKSSPPWSAHQRKVHNLPPCPPASTKFKNDSIEVKRNELKSKCIKSNLPMRTVLKKTESPSKKNKSSMFV